MKLTHLIITILLLGCISISRAEPLSADEILQDVIRRLPNDPLLISGDIVVRRRRGVVVKEPKFEMSLKWGENPSVASYTILDPFGKNLDRLIITRKQTDVPKYEYFQGDPFSSKVVPDLYVPVHGSDLSWMDMSLSFLWWRGGEIKDEEEVKGRKCYVIDVKAPEGNGEGYSMMRLWIDQELRMLMQAEGYDAAGDIKRKLWIKSFKKIDERWMVKDMEVQSYPMVQRTKLRVHEVMLDE